MVPSVCGDVCYDPGGFGFEKVFSGFGSRQRLLIVESFKVLKT